VCQGKLPRPCRVCECGERTTSNHHALHLVEAHLVEAHLVAAAVVKLRRARRGMVRHGSGLFERPAVLEISGHAGRAEAVIANFGGDTGGDRASPDHGIGIGLGQGGQGELARASANRAKQQALGVSG
jgi:hypothetical protein